MTDRLINLTPHPMRIFSLDTPSRVDPTTVTPLATIRPPADHPTARLGERRLGPAESPNTGIPISYVAYGTYAASTTLPPNTAGVWFIVSTLVALAHPNRADLLVPYGTIRDLDGNVIGSTGFARPADPHSLAREANP
ncbi:hypothetical protein AB0J82_06180 [Asanoa sp. NPDC049518]|uniref:hypothetical protein n=1 Tax=unclassified Asanoa TaxID=2685164 RepID=UPI00341D1236